jgi:hypothetical protein
MQQFKLIGLTLIISLAPRQTFCGENDEQIKSLNSTNPKAEEWNNFKLKGAGCDVWGEDRMELAILLRDKILARFDIPWTLENGTLLGAWRSGKFIAHDDDFDIALLFDQDAKNNLKKLLPKIKKLLPAKYDCRLVSSYTDKIEVFEPGKGKYILQGPNYQGADYHYVTVDLQAYEKKPKRGVYQSLYYINPVGFSFNITDIHPIGEISLEGEQFPAPFKTKSALHSIYGSLKPGAKYNQQTGRYEHSDDLLSKN